MTKEYSGYMNTIHRVSFLISHFGSLTPACTQGPDSNNGRYLLLRTEFHSQSEFRTRCVIAHRTRDNLDIPQSKLLMGK